MNDRAKGAPTSSIGLAAALVLVASGCGGGSGGSIQGPDDTNLGTIQVTVQTSAATAEAALDPDGYSVIVGSQSKPIPSAGSVTFNGISTGDYMVELQELQNNCTTPDTPAEATVVAGGTAQVAFHVTCWPPATGRIVFTSTRTGVEEVFVMNADGTGVVQLTHMGTGNCLYTAWSPDDAKIAFIHAPEGIQGNLYVINQDGTGLTQLTSGDHWDRTPSWSPGGSLIAFARGASGSWGDIYLIDSAGDGEAVQLTNHPAGEASPAWSPDGSRILFTTDRDGNDEVYVMNVDGSNPTNLTSNPGDDAAMVGAWSPDGAKIAFSSGREGDSNIYVMDADGSNQIKVTDSSWQDVMAAWSPDGTRIAFRRGPAVNILIAYRDGTGEVELTNTDVLDRFPHWSHGSAGFGAAASGAPRLRLPVHQHQ
jgi:Tol biopolymer transport system component